MSSRSKAQRRSRHRRNLSRNPRRPNPRNQCDDKNIRLYGGCFCFQAGNFACRDMREASQELDRKSSSVIVADIRQYMQSARMISNCR